MNERESENDMALTDQDREWVKAIVKEAVGATANGLKEYTHTVVDGHEHDCRPIGKLKSVLWGIGIGAGLGGTGFGVLVTKIVEGMAKTQ